MPNVRSQELSQDGFTIVGSDGRSVTITKAQIVAFYQTTTGNAASRKAQVIAWIKQQCEAALGANQVPQAVMDIDVDVITGGLSKLTILSTSGA
jgi:hypothetical protein